VSLDQVRSYFGFTKMPFGKSLPPSALYRSAGHQEAVARLSFLVSEQAIGVLTGEVGSGKSVAARAAVAGLDPSRHTVIYLPNPAIGARGLYAEVVSRLGEEPRFHRAALISQATSLLAAEASERGRAIILLVDESHLLNRSQLEELRLLTSSEMGSSSPFALVLIGQPSLRARLRLGSFAALDQRVTLRYALPPMSPDETAGYLQHHLVALAPG
jgi:type II secretory pathway predicted ATPase ExeA